TETASRSSPPIRIVWSLSCLHATLDCATWKLWARDWKKRSWPLRPGTVKKLWRWRNETLSSRDQVRVPFDAADAALLGVNGAVSGNVLCVLRGGDDDGRKESIRRCRHHDRDVLHGRDAGRAVGTRRRHCVRTRTRLAGGEAGEPDAPICLLRR